MDEQVCEVDIAQKENRGRTEARQAGGLSPCPRLTTKIRAFHLLNHLAYRCNLFDCHNTFFK